MKKIEKWRIEYAIELHKNAISETEVYSNSDNAEWLKGFYAGREGGLYAALIALNIIPIESRVREAEDTCADIEATP